MPPGDYPTLRGRRVELIIRRSNYHYFLFSLINEKNCGETSLKSSIIQVKCIDFRFSSLSPTPADECASLAWGRRCCRDNCPKKIFVPLSSLSLSSFYTLLYIRSPNCFRQDGKRLVYVLRNVVQKVNGRRIRMLIGGRRQEELGIGPNMYAQVLSYIRLVHL